MKPRYILIICLTVSAGVTVSILNVLAKTEPQNIEGVIVTKGTLQGYGKSGDRLVVEVKGGITVTVSTLNQIGVVTGDRVELVTYDRYLLGPKYTFLRKLSD